jgi:hypothetical protein
MLGKAFVREMSKQAFAPLLVNGGNPYLGLLMEVGERR